MNAVMNIQVRVVQGNAQQVLRQVQNQINGLNNSIDNTNRNANRSTRSLNSWGNQVQWTGRQIQYNFTLPLLAAGAAAAHWQLENEKAMTRVAKVYGDASLSAEVMKNELKSLGDAFQELSNHFGVNQAEVIQIAGDWAAAGSSGLALAKSVQTTLQAMVLGELEAAEATKALIAIQAQYGLSSEKLTETIGILNAVENQTGISMAGLIKGFQRSAGVARTAGVDVRHLAAMLAAISPAAGSAAEAGNALKTIFSRLASPTRETSQVLSLMGVSMRDMEWKTATATEQLQIMATKFEDLSDKQKEVVSTVVASRWQINKFTILMRELINENGYYQKALDATASRQGVFNLYQKELNTVLSSNPRRLQIIWTMMQNAGTDIIQPMIPLILYLANAVKTLVTWFSNLDPALQKLIIFGAIALAMLGPLIRYIGSLATVIGALGLVLGWVLAPLFMFVGAIGTLAIAAWGALVGGISAVGASLVWLGTMLGVTMGRFFAILGLGIARLVSVIPAMMILMGRAISAGAIVVSAAWAALMYGLGAIFGPLAARLVRAWQIFMLSLSILTTGIGAGLRAAWAGVWVSMQLVMIASSRILGMIWRAATFSIAVTTMTWGAAFRRIWVTIQMLLQGVLIASAATMGVIWRGALALMTATTGAWRALFAGFWAASWALLVGIARAGATAIMFTSTLVGRGIAFLALAPLRFAAVFRGAWAVLAFIARAGVMGIVSAVTSVVAAVGWPVIAAIAVVVALVIAFWDELKTIWDNVVGYFANSGNSLAEAVRNIFGGLGNVMSRVFNMLPESVRNAMVAVVRLVAAAARQVYEWFSYINPFARHSPSLVDNVTQGMAAVRAQFATLAQVEGYVKSAYRTINKFGQATAGLSSRNQTAEFSEKRENIVKVEPGAGPAFDAMVAEIGRLTPILSQLKSAVAGQQAVVDAWSGALDRANMLLDVQQDKLDKVRKVADDLQSQLSDAKTTLDTWADTPIKGQLAMADAIFENSMAQKRLQLQMMDMEKITGPLDDIRSKVSSINGEIDSLQGMRKSMQQGGAGSDILAFYDQQIAGLKGQGSGLGQQAKALQDMQKELDKLQTAGQRLDLVNSLKFDPLARQIEQAGQSMRELPFGEILAGVKSSKAEVDRLTIAYDEASAAVARQQQIVDAHTAARDATQARYGTEVKKLETLKDAYDSVNQAIQDINSSLNDMSQAADSAIKRAEGAKEKKGRKRALSPGAQNFIDAAGGNFPDPGSDSPIGREGGLGDQSKMIDDFTKDLAKETSGMFAGLNPLGPLKKWWDKAWNWLKTYIGPIFSGLGDFIGKAFSGIEIPNPFASAGEGGGWMETLAGWVGPIVDLLKSVGSTIMDIFNTLWGWIKMGWSILSPIFSAIWDNLVGGLMEAWAKIAPEIAKFKDLIKPLGEAINNIWTLIKPVLAIIGGALAAVFLLVAHIVKNTIGPIIEMIGGVIAGVIRVVRGVIEFIVGVFTLDWEMAWNGIKNIFGGVWDIIKSIVVGAWNIVWGVLKGAIDWITQIFGFIWDKAVKPAWNAAWKWIKSTASSIWGGILGFFKATGKWFSGIFGGIWDGIKKAWTFVWNALKSTAKAHWNVFKGIFLSLYNWFKNTFGGVFGIISKAFKGAWDKLVSWFKSAANWLPKPLKGAVNLVIGFINKLIRGLNKVADVLPGLDWEISLIPKLAAGGGMPSRRVGSGFRTNGARAIVGEGNPAHPEYVIPTDPKYRTRAQVLFTSLARDIGVAQGFMGGVPKLKSGGILGAISGAMGDAGSFFSNLGSDIMAHVSDGLATYVMKPIFALANPLINKIPWDYARGVAKGTKKKILDWLSFADEAARDKVEKGGAAGVPAGKIRDWIIKALGIIKEPTSLAKGIYNIIKHESGGNPRAINRWDSNAAQGYDMMSKGLMQTIGPTFRAHAISGHKDIWNPIDNIIAGTRYAIGRYGRNWLKSGGNRDKNGNYIGYEVGGVLGSIPGLKEGAYIRRRVGGTLVRVGEGMTDEAVIPLPGGKDDFGTGKTYNFYGDLSFPNVTDGDDAKDFLDNLETLAGR